MCTSAWTNTSKRESYVRMDGHCLWCHIHERKFTILILNIGSQEKTIIYDSSSRNNMVNQFRNLERKMFKKLNEHKSIKLTYYEQFKNKSSSRVRKRDNTYGYHTEDVIRKVISEINLQDTEIGICPLTQLMQLKENELKDFIQVVNIKKKIQWQLF